MQTLAEKLMCSRRGYDAIVCSGGGIRGISQLGAMAYMQRHRPDILARTRVFAGASVGSIISTVMALGLDAKDVFETVILRWKFTKDVHLKNMTTAFGLDSGQGVDEFIASIVPEHTTFQSIRDDTGALLSIAGTNLNTTSLEIFDVFSTPEMSVREALRISCAVPMLFTAVEWNGCLYADGGIADNFPYRSTTDRYGSKKTLGITFHREMNPQRFAWTFETFINAIVESAINAPYVTYPAGMDVIELRTIPVNPLDFNISHDEKRILFESGANQAEAFFKKNT